MTRRPLPPPPELTVELVVAELALLDAAVEGDDALARALGCEVAAGWQGFPKAVPVLRDAVAVDPEGARWGPRFFVESEPHTVIGWGGFKGAPRDAARAQRVGPGAREGGLHARGGG
jgi:hypothetical protein